MRPEKLIISAWGPYKDRVEIDFSAFDGKGLFLVTGATGAGKTTIFDAITYALYGNLSGEVREKGSVRSDFAGVDTPTFVELFMRHAGKEYHIVRNPEYVRLKKKGKQGKTTKEKENAVIYLPDGKVVEGNREVNAKMQEILILNYAQFKKITMIAQGEFARLLLASPKDKTDIFRDIFGTGIYGQFAQSLRAKSSVLFDKVKEQRHKLEEDIRLLAKGREMQKLGRLAELTEGDSQNYAAVLEELESLCLKAGETERKQQEECSRLGERNIELTEEVTRKKQENEEIDRWHKNEQALANLDLQKTLMEEKRRVFARACAADALVSVRHTFQRAKEAWEVSQNKLKKQKADLKALEGEIEELKPLLEKQDLLRQYLEYCRRLEENGRLLADSKKECEKADGEWDKAKSAYLKAEKVRDEKQAAFSEAERVYRHAAAGIAARMLKPGMPCPVCGSTEHPNPAKKEPGLLSEAALAKLEKEAKEAEKVLQKEHEKTISCKHKAEDLARRLEELLQEKDELENTTGEYDRQFTETVFEDSGFLRADYRRKTEFVREKTNRLTGQNAMLQSLADRIEETEKELVKAKEELEDSREAWMSALSREGFEDEGACEKARMLQKDRQALEKEIADYEERQQRALGIKEHLEGALQNWQKHEVELLEEEVINCRQNLENAQGALKASHAFFAEVNKTRDEFKKTYKKMKEAEAEYGYVEDLNKLASGNNKKRLVFEQYVLASYFEEILRAANLRFLKMTDGRFEMSRVEEAGDGRVKDSLEIQVMDYYTGKPRLIKTLSGGESFKASLSLALGMSDVIQAMNGGIKVDTLFIDEGFGALDAQSLDQACEALMGLVENNRLIGIVSHVPELQERIDCQLIVEKTNTGSSIKVRV